MIVRANLVSIEFAERLGAQLTELQCVLLITVAELGSITIKRPRRIVGDAFELYDAAVALAWSRPIPGTEQRATMIDMTNLQHSIKLTIEHLGRDVAACVVERLTK